MRREDLAQHHETKPETVFLEPPPDARPLVNPRSLLVDAGPQNAQLPHRPGRASRSRPAGGPHPSLSASGLRFLVAHAIERLTTPVRTPDAGGPAKQQALCAGPDQRTEPPLSVADAGLLQNWMTMRRWIRLRSHGGVGGVYGLRAKTW